MKRLFIVGCPRSGTTWTMLMLAQHPNVAACQQTGLFIPMAHLKRWWGRNSQFGKSIIRFSDASVSDEAPAADDDDGLILENLLEKQHFYDACRSYATEVYRRVVEGNPDAEVILDQTPEHVRVAPLILQIFPDAFFLHVLRDPRAAVSSLRNAARSFAGEHVFPTDARDAAHYWRAHVNLGRRIKEATERYREIRYEALLEDPPGELAKILAWLEIPNEGSFCEEAVNGARLERMRKHRKAPKGFFRKGKADSWRSELTTGDLRAVEYITSELMAELGYEREVKQRLRKPFPVRIHESLQAGAAATRRAVKRLLWRWQTESYWDY